MRLKQVQKGYRYNSDTLFLHDFISRFAPRGHILDVGCGCGVLGLLVARDFPVSLCGIDIQEENVVLARDNAKHNGIESDYIIGNFLTHKWEKRFDFIISNPPFYGEHKPHSPYEHVEISRNEKYLPLKEFIYHAAKLIPSNKGGVIFCYDPKRIDILLSALTQGGLKCADLAFVHPRAQKPATLVLVRAVKNGRHEIKIHPPYIAFDGENYTEQLQQIYAKSATHSLT